MPTMFWNRWWYSRTWPNLRRNTRWQYTDYNCATYDYKSQPIIVVVVVMKYYPSHFKYHLFTLSTLIRLKPTNEVFVWCGYFGFGFVIAPPFFHDALSCAISVFFLSSSFLICLHYLFFMCSALDDMKEACL